MLIARARTRAASVREMMDCMIMRNLAQRRMGDTSDGLKESDVLKDTAK
jgi:hypothetical protein